MHRWLTGLLAATLLVQFASQSAAQTPAPSASPPPASAVPGTTSPVPLPSATVAPSGKPPISIGQVPPNGAPIALEAGKGTLLRLNAAAATVFIANPDIADVQVKSPSLIYLSAKAPGETVIYAVDAADNVLLHSPVRVEHDLSRVRESMRQLMPGENISVSAVENSLVLKGDVSSAGRAEKARALAASVANATDIKNANVVNQLAVSTPNQVNLRVKIAEVNRTALKALGFNFFKQPINCVPGGTSGVGGIACGNVSNLLLQTGNPITNQAITATNQFAFGIGGTHLETIMDALSQENLIVTLAEPNLTATSGQTASFLAGGEFPVPIAGNGQGNGGYNITVDYKTFGVALDFTPTIIDANHLSLKVRPEVSQLSTTGAVSVPLTATAVVTIPALTVRRAETTVDLASGQSFALAGLLQHSSEQDISKIPWLGDIPILGQLFRSNLFQRNETELVIIVTPYLVKPSNTQLAAPTDGFVLPHDAERIATNATFKQTLPGPQRGPQPAGGQPGLIGPVGFKLD
jgi:pilus assembly protein CpaC